MRILLIQPSSYTEDSMVKEAETTMPSISLLYLASNLVGHEVEILDMNVPNKGIQKTMEGFDPDFIGITVFSTHFPQVIELVKKIRQIKKDVKIVLGGPHINTCGEDVAKNYDFFDYLLKGEAEVSFRELVDGKNPKDVAGVITKDFNNDLAYVKNLDELNFPARELINRDHYSESPIYYRNEPHTFMLTSRGCPHKCIFCDNAGRAPLRLRSAGNVIEELRLIEEQGYKDFRIMDEFFTAHVKRAEGICDAMIKKKMDFTWHCQTRSENINSNLLNKMKRAGCFSLQIGVETGNQRIMEKIQKKLDLKKVEESVKLIKKAGIEVYASFMLGFPFENEKEMNDTIEFAKKLDLDLAFFSIVTPFPSTKLWEDYKDEYGFDSNNLECLKSMRIYSTKGSFHDQKLMEKMYRKALKSFYFRPKTIARVFKTGILHWCLNRRKKYLRFLLSEL